MKRFNLYFLLFLIIMLASCRNDDVDTSFRIKQKVYSNNNGDEELKYVYQYKDNNIVSETLYKKDHVKNKWEESYYNDYKYDLNSVTSTGWTYNINKKIWEENANTDYKLDNGSIVEITTNGIGESSINNSSTIIIKYQDSRISEINVSWGFKWLVNYKDGLISDFTVYKKHPNSNFYASSKCNYLYSGKQLDYIDVFNAVNKYGKLNTSPDSRYGYSYSNNIVTNTSLSTYNSTNLVWENESYTTYKYNSFGCLVQQIEKDGSSISFEYEAGEGNASLFRYFTSVLYTQPYSKVKSQCNFPIVNEDALFRFICDQTEK